MRPGDIGPALDRVSERNVSRRSTLRQAKFDLGAAGGIEAGTQPHQPGNHHRVRVGLHRIVNPRALQPPLKRLVTRRNLVDIQHQRRPVEAGAVQEGRNLLARLRGQAEGWIRAGLERRRSGAPMRSGNHRRSP
jgi:hypothetical protein